MDRVIAYPQLDGSKATVPGADTYDVMVRLPVHLTLSKKLPVLPLGMNRCSLHRKDGNHKRKHSLQLHGAFPLLTAPQQASPCSRLIDTASRYFKTSPPKRASERTSTRSDPSLGSAWTAYKVCSRMDAGPALEGS